MPIDVHRDNYEQEVLNAPIPVLVDFWGPRCTNCLALMPTVEEIERKYEGNLKVAKLDASKNRRLCMSLRVMGLPTFILYRDGQEVGRLVGEMMPSQLEQKIDSLMSPIHV
jgi:thioredoxin 1